MGQKKMKEEINNNTQEKEKNIIDLRGQSDVQQILRS